MFNILIRPPRVTWFAQLVIPVAIVLILLWTFLGDTSIPDATTSKQNPSYQVPPITSTLEHEHTLPEPTEKPPPQQIPPYRASDEEQKNPLLDYSRHPIDDLIDTAGRSLDSLLAKESHDVYAAEKAYLVRRGRRPPPGFGAWFEFAQRNNATIVEDFFDRIYDDLNPFWAVPASDIRLQAKNWFFRISVRNGNATIHGDEVERQWLLLWADMIGSVAEHLPDLDIAINEMDESRILVPWEAINVYMGAEEDNRQIVRTWDAVTDFNVTINPDDAEPQPFDFAFSGTGPYWDQAVIGCPPDSQARHGYLPETDFERPLPSLAGQPKNSYQGYVQNWTLAKSPCDNPQLQALHGTFVEPVSLANTKKLIPMFGGSKLPMNNEILLPPAMYWTTDPFYSGGEVHGGSWDDKRDQLVWRGAASGGRNKKENWTRFHRHRFVAMMNSTSIATAEADRNAPPNMNVPAYEAYPLASLGSGALSRWIGKIADAAFVHLLCFPDTGQAFCPYTTPWFTVKQSLPMSAQYEYKYLPDIDGNSFSGRYRGFLSSTSLPIKATIYNEWHDSRLVPWKHFVPMDNTFADIYGILEYFIGFGPKANHDDAAKKIALEGKAWAERVLRREDMQIYTFRLLLEYARICDDNRMRLAWLSSSSSPPS